MIPSLWKESLNSNGHPFHQYQQSKQQPLILTELTEHSKRALHVTLEIQPCTQCGGVKPVSVLNNNKIKYILVMSVRIKATQDFSRIWCILGPFCEPISHSVRENIFSPKCIHMLKYNTEMTYWIVYNNDICAGDSKFDENYICFGEWMFHSKRPHKLSQKWKTT